MSIEEGLPRIQDVARHAGVSTATVSRALSHPDMVAEATREAVLDAVRKTGYRVHQAARNLRRGRTGAIVVLVPNIGNPFFSQVLAGIGSVAVPLGYNVLVADTLQPHTRREKINAYLHHDRADGLIVLDGTLSLDLAHRKRGEELTLPVVFACEWTLSSNFPSVMIDNREGARRAIEHLHALGHRKIGHVSGPAPNVLTQARREGARMAMQSLGLDVRGDWFLQGDFTLQSGIDAANSWMAMNDRPTAMFCASDEMAFGFISELNRGGYRVPDQISVAGFDDIDISRCYIPALTTIRQPRLDIGSIAATMLIQLISAPGEELEQPARYLPVELIVRDSTAAPPAP
jgi:LacI family repressor for deo operon, udp, cdd, tsx, nupC, and nupG